MAKVELTATKELRYGGKWLKDGDDFEAESMHAKLLIAIGKAKTKEEKPKPKAKPSPPAQEFGTYSTRDMQPKKQ